jgi:hypothetical protein
MCVPFMLFAGFLIGCGGASEEKLVPASGSVTAAGKPLPFGIVTFTPDAAKGNKARFSPIGNLDANGKFELKTNGQPGAPLGSYRVTIATDVPGVTPPGKSVPIAQKYRDPATTPLKAEVVEKSEPFNLTVD